MIFIHIKVFIILDMRSALLIFVESETNIYLETIMVKWY